MYPKMISGASEMLSVLFFYMNYNPNPQEMPWKDSISHAVRILKGTEYTITRPRDMFFATSEMLSRITRSKRSHPEPAVATSASR